MVECARVGANAKFVTSCTDTFVSPNDGHAQNKGREDKIRLLSF